MMIRYRYPLPEMNALRQQMDEIFRDITSSERGTTTTWNPAIEVIDHRDRLELRVLLPGLTAESIDIQATPDSVAISGTAEAGSNQRYVVSEFQYGSFRRVVRLPIDIDHTHITAHLDQGILTLVLPKMPTAYVVKVNVGQQSVPTAELTSADAHPVDIQSTPTTATETGLDPWASAPSNATVDTAIE